ncbi:hypothetical protein [Frigidibacter mobilis]|nr:hypothetical protein [Frigidibacter mobilis]
MMMRSPVTSVLLPARLVALLALLALAGCAAQPAACTSSAARDLRTLDTLIAESRQNLARGYAVGSGNSGRGNTSVNFCMGNSTGNVGLSFCSGGNPTRRSGPVAIDLDAERAKLESMLQQRPALASRAAADAAACTSARG